MAAPLVEREVEMVSTAVPLNTYGAEFSDSTEFDSEPGTSAVHTNTGASGPRLATVVPRTLSFNEAATASPPPEAGNVAAAGARERTKNAREQNATVRSLLADIDQLFSQRGE